MKRTVFFLVIILALITSTFSQNPDCIYCGNNELGETSSAIGNLNQNYGEFSLTIGNSNIIARRLQMVTLIGSNNVANGDLIGNHSGAFGINNLIDSDNSYTIGIQDTVSATGAIAIGAGTRVTGSYAVGIGLNSKVFGNYSAAIGSRAHSMAMNSYSFGYSVWSDAIGSITIGASPIYLKNTVPYSLIVGFNSDMSTFFVGSSSGSGTTGKVGIGNVTDPQAKLHIKADVSEDATLKLEPTGIRKIAKLLMGTDDYFLAVEPGNDLRFSTPSGENFNFENGNIHGVNGTAQIPTYAFSSSYNTGMYLPSTSTIAFSTNAVERVRITSTGNVGIGTTNPSSDRLEVNGFAKTSSGYKVSTYIVINSYSDYSGRNGTFSGNLAVTGTSTLNGNVGIGTNPTSNKLSVNGTVQATSFLGNGAGLTNVPGDNLGNHTATQNIKLSGKWLSGDGGDEGIFINSDGNVGIGTTTPAERLEVAGWAKTSNGYKVGTSPVIDINRNFSGNNSTFEGTLNVTGTSTLNGNVGIGISPTSNKLTVNGNIDATSFSGDGTELNNVCDFRWSPSYSNSITTNGSVVLGILNYSGSESDEITITGPKFDVRSTTEVNRKSANFIDSDGRRIFFVPKLGGYGYNPISSPNDAGIFWSDGLEIGGQNQDAGFVIGPHRDGQAKGIKIDKDGSVGIGTTETTSYKLTVAGKIRATEVRVQNIEDWYDCVFDDDYNLSSVQELENYIAKNKHLPDVPSEAEVYKEGINLGEMDAILLKKIEELTLYVIELKKENMEMKQEISELKK